MNQRRLRMYRDDELLSDDEWIPEDDEVPDAEELRQCFRRWWRWPVKTALLVLLLLSWEIDPDLDYVAQDWSEKVAKSRHHLPPTFVSAAGSQAVLPTVREREGSSGRKRAKRGKGGWGLESSRPPERVLWGGEAECWRSFLL